MTTGACRAFVLGRRRKGRKIEARVREVVSALEAAHWSVDSGVVKRKRDLTRKASSAVKAGSEVIVIVGGDGAALRVVPALDRTNVALAIVPTGTGNLLAGNLGIPRDLRGAVRTILSGRRRQIDLGRVTLRGVARDFSVACGIGFDAEVMDATRPSQKRRWGKLAYLTTAALRSGAISNVSHEITLDGVRTTTDAAQIFIANFGRIVAGVAPRRTVRPDDQLLDVIVIRASGPMGGLLGGWEALRQRDLGDSTDGRAFRAQAREIQVRSTPPQLVEIDGTVIGRTPISVSIRPAALNVIVPAK